VANRIESRLSRRNSGKNIFDALAIHSGAANLSQAILHSSGDWQLNQPVAAALKQ
jgi:hypothetical protein